MSSGPPSNPPLFPTPSSAPPPPAMSETELYRPSHAHSPSFGYPAPTYSSHHHHNPHHHHQHHHHPSHHHQPPPQHQLAPRFSPPRTQYQTITPPQHHQLPPHHAHHPPPPLNLLPPQPVYHRTMHAPYSPATTNTSGYSPTPPVMSYGGPQSTADYEGRRYSGSPSASSREMTNPESPHDRRRSSGLLPSPSYTTQRIKQERGDDTPTYPTFASSSAEGTQSSSREVLPGDLRYTIKVRQQPLAARACGFGERDRRVIDPPPIVQLVISDDRGNASSTEMKYPFNVVHCTLYSENGERDETALTGVDKRLTRRLMGTLVASPFFGQDEDGVEGCFFTFPDLSCRTHGKYRLRFVLMRIEPSSLRPGAFTPIITETLSDVFQVFTAKEFPGMRPSTALTKALKKQGCAISVKKGVDKSGPGGVRDEGSDDDDQGQGQPKRRRRK